MDGDSEIYNGWRWTARNWGRQSLALHDVSKMFGCSYVLRFSLQWMWGSLSCDVHVTVHRDQFLIIKTTRYTNFSNLFLKWNSTCFGQFLWVSSGVFHPKHSNAIQVFWQLASCQQTCMTYTIAIFKVKNSWWWTEKLSEHVEFHFKNKFEKLLHSCQQTCMTYTIAVFTVKNSWWWTEKLSETCIVSFQEEIWEISAFSWFYYEKSLLSCVLLHSDVSRIGSIDADEPAASIFRVDKGISGFLLNISGPV